MHKMPSIYPSWRGMHDFHIGLTWKQTPRESFLDAVPTAELEPITATYVQADEVRAMVVSKIRIHQLIHTSYRLTWV
jgi:hypothetical protein